MLISRWFGRTVPVPQKSYTSLKEDIEANPTIFGQLLRAEAPVQILFDEDDEFFAFRNIKPYAPLAGLVIPRRYIIQDPDGLAAEHLPLVLRLKDIGMKLVDRYYPSSRECGDYRLRFHRPPFNSVSHLHLHVLAPASSFPISTHIVFAAPTPWAIDVDDVIARLKAEADQEDSNSTLPLPS